MSAGRAASLVEVLGATGLCLVLTGGFQQFAKSLGPGVPSTITSEWATATRVRTSLASPSDAFLFATTILGTRQG
eukprot:scaffold3826_cov407-Prasinococcus_capsulatus_cf.AAC.18